MVGCGDEREAAFAAQTAEVVGQGESGQAGDAVALDEIASRFGGLEHAQDAQCDKGHILQHFAGAGLQAVFHDLAQRSEEDVFEELGQWVSGQVGGGVREWFQHDPMMHASH